MQKGNSFDEKAASWDENPNRTKLVEQVWELIKRTLDFNTIDKVLDYGSGTGLLGYKAVKTSKEVCFCDNSSGMLEQVQKKSDFYGYQNVKIIKTDFITDDLPDERYDLILSMLVLHHVENINLLLSKFNQILNPGGMFCWIDLDQEDGTFHSDNTGIAHFGFSKERIEKLLQANGFIFDFYTCELTYPKETVDGVRHFPIFVSIGRKHDRQTDR
jgi:ubiquinone/menaquinone biosynthesis C-methylase UbiE